MFNSKLNGLVEDPFATAFKNAEAKPTEKTASLAIKAMSTAIFRE